jgi:hypothetical protein
MARDRDTGIVKPAPVIVDEQAKAAAMRAAAATAPAAAAAIAKTPDQLAIDRLNAQIAKTQSNISSLENTATQLGAINPAAMTKAAGETNTQFNVRVKAAEALARQNAVAENPLLNKAAKPTDAPAGKYYAWVGGTDTGQWQLYDIPGYGTVGTGGGNIGGNNAGGGNTSGGNTNTVVDKTLVSTDIDNTTGDTIGYFSDGSKIVLNKGTGPVQSAEFKDAYALLNQTFRDYGLESLVPAIEGFMKRNLGPNQAAVELRSMPEYIKRFKGNDLRRASGKNALTEAEYLAVEDAYDQTLRAYGQQNYFGIDRKTKQEKAAELIGNDISAVEFKDRIQLSVDRVQNADPAVKSMLKQFYPTLNEADLIGYFLNPTDNLPKLKEKVTASEIGAAAAGFNLGTDLASATDLAKYGVDQAQAREGYSTISGVLPEAKKLGDIYGESGIKYAQKEAEAEVFKGNQDAATKRKRLASMERAAFSGSSGTGQSSITRNTQGLL